MNVKILYASIAVAVALAGVFAIFQGGAKLDIYSCSQDSDCAKAKGGCCSCNMGGTAIAINKNFESEWTGKLAKECSNIACLAVISNDPSCFKEPKCVENMCALE